MLMIISIDKIAPQEKQTSEEQGFTPTGVSILLLNVNDQADQRRSAPVLFKHAKDKSFTLEV